MDMETTIKVMPRRTKLLRVDVSNDGYEPPFGWCIIDYKACNVSVAVGGNSGSSEYRESRHAIVLIERLNG